MSSHVCFPPPRVAVNYFHSFYYMYSLGDTHWSDTHSQILSHTCMHNHLYTSVNILIHMLTCLSHNKLLSSNCLQQQRFDKYALPCCCIWFVFNKEGFTNSLQQVVVVLYVCVAFLNKFNLPTAVSELFEQKTWDSHIHGLSSSICV